MGHAWPHPAILQARARPPLGHGLRIDPIAFAQRLDRSLRSLYCCSDGVSGRGASVKYLSQSASLVVATPIVPSPPHPGTKQLARGACRADGAQHAIDAGEQLIGGERLGQEGVAS